MTTYLAPILFVILLWWFSTGAVLWLARGLEKQLPARLLGVTVLTALGFAGAVIASNSTHPVAPYVGFASSLAIWSWVEFTFLTGMITGPRVEPCPANISEQKRFQLAFATVSRHEFLLVAALLAVGLVTLGGHDQTAFWSFATLWLMRISAKLTIFSGVPSFSRDMMPRGIAHLHSYFRDDRIGPVFWVSMIGTFLVFAFAAFSFGTGLVSDEKFTMLVMLTTLIALAAFEHLMMILPFKETALWQWAMAK
jgi:putative photosynthetic complex assembly protein 2